MNNYSILTRIRAIVICNICLLMFACGGGNEEASSPWAGEYESPHGVRLALEADPNGSIGGELFHVQEDVESSFPVQLHVVGAALEGTFANGTDSFPLRVENGEAPGQIVVTSEGAIYELSRKRDGQNPLLAANPASPNPLVNEPSDTTPAKVAEEAPSKPKPSPAEVVKKAPSKPAPAKPVSSSRKVVINGQRIDDAKLASIEGPTPLIPDGDYWYDKKSGMAGSVNGPTEAYLAAGLDLGGPLSEDASGGATHVAFNGRYLHPIDLAGLEYYFGEIMPGRYWLDGNGNYGQEGGPQEGNLVEEIAAIEMFAAEMQAQMQYEYQAQLQQQVQAYQGQGGYYGQGGDYYNQGGGSVYSHFPNLGASGTGVGVANVGGGDTIVNAGGVLWWPGK